MKEAAHNVGATVPEGFLIFDEIFLDKDSFIDMIGNGGNETGNKITICKNCDHGICRNTSRNVWYHWYCGVSKRKPAIDVVTGVSGFEARKGLFRF